MLFDDSREALLGKLKPVERLGRIRYRTADESLMSSGHAGQAVNDGTSENADRKKVGNDRQKLMLAIAPFPVCWMLVK